MKRSEEHNTNPFLDKNPTLFYKFLLKDTSRAFQHIEVANTMFRTTFIKLRNAGAVTADTRFWEVNKGNFTAIPPNF